MALNGCLKLTRIVNRILTHGNFISVNFARNLSSNHFKTHSQNAFSAPVTCRLNSRNFSSVAQSELNVSHETLKRVLSSRTGVVIDVREPWELREYGAIPGSINVPLGQVNQALGLSPEEFREKYGSDMPSQGTRVVFSCLAGIRSKVALDTAVSLGYSNVQHYPGGWEDWARQEALKTKF